MQIFLRKSLNKLYKNKSYLIRIPSVNHTRQYSIKCGWMMVVIIEYPRGLPDIFFHITFWFWTKQESKWIYNDVFFSRVFVWIIICGQIPRFYPTFSFSNIAVNSITSANREIVYPLCSAFKSVKILTKFKFWAQREMYCFYKGVFFSFYYSVNTFPDSRIAPIFTYDTSKHR